MSGLSTVDLLIIALYLGTMIGIGIWAKKLAERGLDSYFLGEQRLPWWMLAMSGSSSYWDITGTMISPEVYHGIFKPRHRLIYEAVRKRSGVHLFLHSCGSIVDILPDLIEIGVEIINPVQTSARGMEPERLKREFGKDIIFWGGGCDTQNVLPNRIEKEIEEHVRRRLEIFKPGGGFVFTQIHNIMPNVPPQNIVDMHDAVKKYS